MGKTRRPIGTAGGLSVRACDLMAAALSAYSAFFARSAFQAWNSAISA